ncbi:Putative membrane protein YdgH [BD1-7 clade bacterium]|uniref:Membrane protein YdgH n=1 Tax=BD1-7 clade bacterium TaxID=2029982 RepID=A0A5S9QXU1_9GAMM|nr:Putative membrane protein YdgH [BD1-7 clade bacterium]
MESPIVQAIMNHAGKGILFSLLAVIIMAAGVSRFDFDDDARNNFPPDDPFFLKYSEIENEYGQIDSALMLLSAKDGSIFTRKHLQSVAWLTEKSWELPHSRRVDSIANYQHTYSDDDELIVEAVLEAPADLTDEQIAEYRDIFVNEPTLVNRLVNRGGSDAIVNVMFNLSPESRKKDEIEIDQAVRALVAELQVMNPDLDVYLNGRVINNTAVAGGAYDDIKSVIPVMYLIIYGLLAILLRSLVAVVGVYLLTVMSVVACLGLSSWFGITISLLSLTSINVIITVSMAHCVHILVNFLQTYRTGVDKKEALKSSLLINVKPIFLTSLTTAIGFLSMNFSEMPTAQDLGNITAIGVVIVFVLSLSFLPGYLLLLPINRKASGGNHYAQWMDRFADIVVARKGSIFLVVLAVSVLLLALAPRNIINDRFTETIKAPHEFRTSTDYLDQEFGGLYTIEYSLKADGPGGISDPQYLQHLDDFTEFLRAQPDATQVQSYTDIIKRLNQNMHNDDPAFYRIPESRELAAQYLLLYEMSLPYGLDMDLSINSDKSATRLIVGYPTLDSRDVFRHEHDNAQWLEKNAPASMYHPGASLSVTWAHLGGRAMVSSIEGALLALFTISVVLAFALRSAKFGLISMIPNLLPAGIGFGIWALYVGELGMAHMTILGITIGIVVDDTVHFLSKYLHAQRLGKSTEDAVRFAFHSVGPALWITTLVLVAGFLMMSTSSFRPNSDLGLMAAVILVAALVLDFLLLPPLLMFIDRKTNKAPVVTAEAG